MEKNNIFNFATSELSQDAFLCWFINWINYKDSEPVLYKKAKEFIDTMLKRFLPIEYKKVDIYKQFHNIDVMCIINDKWIIIIEDKTGTSEHDDQINTYKKNILKLNDDSLPKGLKEEDITCVYYKIYEECGTNKNADVVFDREAILNILKSDDIKNDIYCDYYDRIKQIDEEANQYKKLPISDWSGYNYPAFFKHLEKTLIPDCGWGYVPNRSGGFWGLWWHSIGDKFAGTKYDNAIDDMYLQFEDSKLAVKCTARDEFTTELRWKIYEYFLKACLVKGLSFTKRAFHPGKYMTIGYVEYNQKNYEDAIKKMEEIMDNCADNI